MPLILIGQNRKSRYTEIKSRIGFCGKYQSEKEIEVILLHLEQQNELVMEILKKIEGGKKKQ